MGGAGESPSKERRNWVLDAVTGIADALVVIDADASVVYMNPAGERLVGQCVDAEGLLRLDGTILGDCAYRPDLVTPFPPDETPLARALRGEVATEVAMYLRSKQADRGFHIVASAHPIRGKEDRVAGAACVFRDVTALKEKADALRQAERQTKAILDNIPDMAWLKDRDGRFVVVNQRFAEAAGRETPEEVIGLTDLDFWPRGIAEGYRADDDAIIASGETLRVEEPIIYHDGHQGWIETVKARIVDDAGNVIGTTGIARDITERRRHEQDLRSTTDELEQRVMARTAELAEAQENLVRQERLAVLGQLAGGVAHQIRNPLAAIMNATYVLKRHLKPDQHPNVADAIGIIHDEVRHANIIITGLLDYARVRTPDRHPASLVEMLERILASDWIPPNVRIVRDVPEHDGLVQEVDVDQLQGAIANLVRNAVDAMPDGGELGIELGSNGEEIIITVSDTGPGLSPQVRAHLFEPLHSTKPLGIGLGLVTARRFVEAHGGRIRCVDVPNGARFEVHLPFRAP